MYTSEILNRVKNLLPKREEPSERTFQRYAKDGVIPKPTLGYRQGYPGYQADYPSETVAEYYAAHMLMHEWKWKVTMKELAKVRKDALRLLNERWTADSLADFVRLRWSYLPAIERWLTERERIIQGARLDEILGLRYMLLEDGKLEIWLTPGENAQHYGYLLDVRRPI